MMTQNNKESRKLNSLKAIITGNKYIMIHIISFHESCKEKHKKNFKKVFNTIEQLSVLSGDVMFYHGWSMILTNRISWSSILEQNLSIKELNDLNTIHAWKKKYENLEYNEIISIFLEEGCITPSLLRLGLIVINRDWADNFLTEYSINWRHYFHDKCKRNWRQNGFLKIKK